MANVTIKDVAKEAGVAVETVSRVLNNRGYISQQMKDRVYEAMNRIGYTPNAFAQGLSRGKMNCIALIVPHITHPYFATVIDHLEREAEKRGQHIIIYNSNGDEQKEEYLLRLCQNSLVSGVLLFSADISADALKNLQLPIVVVERTGMANSVNIQCDNRLGGELAACYLLDKGCRDLLVLGTLNNEDMPGDSRDEEFIRICTAEHAQVHRYQASTRQYITMDYHACINQALDEHPSCDGIFATSDLIAAQVIQECSRRGRRIPQDLRLVGFDDVPLAQLLTPTLTTIRQPIDRIVSTALDAIERLGSGHKTTSDIVLPVTLVERES
ncbi:MAG: LacI family DNA-binding transcriptional regulator [Butyrivibrio sp.]|nr:LacI family DNA-binding transcriptional regulator [Butyrivibrio sp.]